MASLRPADLADLESLLAPYRRVAGEKRYRRAHWLLNDFDSMTWIVRADTTFEIHWCLPMYDGSKLTDHLDLWETLRSWLICRTHIDITGGSLCGARTERSLLQMVLHCIDYLLLHAKDLRLLEHGLKGLSENEVRAMLAAIGSNRSVHVGVYEWKRRLSRYLREKIADLPSDAIERAILLQPVLRSELPDQLDRLTDLDERETLMARAWVALQGWYRPGRKETEYRYRPHLTPMAAEIYACTVAGRHQKWKVPKELCLAPDHYFSTEFPRARVHSPRDELASRKGLSRYTNALLPLPLLRTESLAAPAVNIDGLHSFCGSLRTKSDGRFRTLPQAVVFRAMRSAIHYLIEYGDDLVTSYLAVLRAAFEAGATIPQFLRDRHIDGFLTDRCRRLGIEAWTIAAHQSSRDDRDEVAKSEWYRDLRRNRGLWESLQVMYGAVQLVVGLVMARRAGELVDLRSGECLDESKTRLLFRNRKSGIAGVRELEARPIPPVAVRFVQLLERLQNGLIEVGAIAKETGLFATPVVDGTHLRILHRTTYSDAMDVFCDWSETGLDKDGNRYYIRQHQLRRFFAMLFFWGAGFGGMDALRWFLAQTDVKHLWHYITESTPGLTIRSVAAEWAAYQVQHATDEAQLLSNVLSEQFGISDFSALEEEALAMHIEDLMEEGRLVIEPQFLDGGNRYRIAVIVGRGEGL
jgi:hypothetical protein